jgi:hypothetical protein
MTSQNDSAVWARILLLMEEKMQFGFLEQARFVLKVEFEGSHALLTVCSDEAREFFSSQVNQQRLMIVSRPVVSINQLSIVQVNAEPLE